MKEEILVWLHDIKTSALNIEEFYASTEKSFHEFSRNKMLRQAIERNLEIIGEGMNRVLQADSNIAITDAKRIISLRNRISHEYDKLDDETLYTISIKYLPKLLQEVELILDKNKP
ncbi:MAG TPA: HepT-like ribonuclease domain-containing protein [Chitinophagales bacterium]|nr:HepT-like ribonuclease domain-containing protein [Chitinophagales bacterium]